MTGSSRKLLKVRRSISQLNASSVQTVQNLRSYAVERWERNKQSLLNIHEKYRSEYKHFELLELPSIRTAQDRKGRCTNQILSQREDFLGWS
jgi:hypothetical protein